MIERKVTMNTDKFGIANKAYVFRDNMLLLIYKTDEEARNDPNPTQKLDLPGGRLEFGENPYRGLMREVFEEVGISVNVIKPIAVWTYIRDNFQLVGINYLCEWQGGAITLSAEHERFEWVTLHELKERGVENFEQYVLAFNEWRSYRES